MLPSRPPFPPPQPFCQIGVDGGGSKTDLILVDAGNTVVARGQAPGCNPSIAGPERAGLILSDALYALRAKAPFPIKRTMLCMAGARGFWEEFAARLPDFGQVVAMDDARPVLELATNGAPGVVLHSGTGSFVAARAPDGSIHYAGGLGWRFGDPGSGYDLGRRMLARGLLEMQGWAQESRISAVLRDHTGLDEAGAITRFFYDHVEPNRQIAALTPMVLRLTEEGDPTARKLVEESAGELLELAGRVVARLFPGVAPAAVPAGLSGPILTHRVVVSALSLRTSLLLTPIDQLPIEGVRRLLAR